MRLMVTGAGGMLGSDVVAASLGRGDECIGLTREQLDVTDGDAVAASVNEIQPEAIVNCAAWTAVDSAEQDEVSAFAVNAHGAGNLARAAVAAGARLVQVSTDYVFDGAATVPYLESDRTAPQTAYGRTKLAGEHAVLATSTAHAVVRSAWLFGVNGRNFVSTMLEQADAGRREIAVVTDQIGCPTFTGHLAARLLDHATSGRGGIFHAAAAGWCSWNEFAQAIFTAAGLDVDVTETTSAELARPAQRPAWSVLGTERSGEVLPPWSDGLAAYLAVARNGSQR